jgi:hypothetical protein
MEGATFGVFVPAAYTSGAAISDSSTWNSTTISGLGMTPGTYVWTWGSGATADSFTVVVAPEPASLTLFGIGVLSLALLLRRRRVAS